MLKQELIDGVTEKFQKLVESGFQGKNEDIIKTLDTVMPGLYEAYIVGGQDAIDLVRTLIEEVYEDKESANG